VVLCQQHILQLWQEASEQLLLWQLAPCQAVAGFATTASNYKMYTAASMTCREPVAALWFCSHTPAAILGDI
jgi:hypothetical protein